VSRAGVALEPLVPAWVPVPLPRAFVTGLDQQTADVEIGEFRGFLRRDWYRAGSWSYVLWVLLIKLPIPLLGLAALRALARPRLDREDAFLLVPAAAYLGAAILGHELQGALRYVLLAFPLVLASVGRVMESSLGRSRLGGGLVATLLAGHVLASMGTAPRYLSYFNELAGGPLNGYRHLLDSNLDWGQELFELRDYLARRGNPPVKLAYFGHVDPALYGIRFEIPEGPDEPHGGLYAVSANYLMGHPYLVTRNGTLLPVPRDRFTWLQRHQPVARVGHSFFVYELP
jgi:hypothetical protein